MELAEKMNLDGVVIHMCSMKAVDEKWVPFNMTVKETVKRMINHMEYFFKNDGKKYPKTKILLENSASRKTKIGGDLSSLANVYRPLEKKYKKQIGICIDTCHAFASGYALHTPKGVDDFFSEFEKKIGSPKKITLIHLNDSKDPLGSNKDHHECIGQGYIFKGTEGQEALKTIIRYAKKYSIPLCLETPCPNHQKEMKLVKLKKQKGGHAKKKNKNKSVKEILSLLEEFVSYHKSLGNVREASQYQKAISSLSHLNPHQEIYCGKELLPLPGIGKGIASKIDEFISTGKVSLLKTFQKNPKIKAIRSLEHVFAIGPKKAKELVEKGVLSVSNLEKKIRKGHIKLNPSQEKGLKYYHFLSQRISRKKAETFFSHFQKITKKKFPKSKLILAGSYRLQKKDLGDIDIIVSTPQYKNPVFLKTLIEHLIQHGIIIDSLVGDLIPKKNQKMYVGVGKIPKSKNVYHVDIHLVNPGEVPFHLLYFGSGELFSRQIRQHAKKMGYRLNQKGLFQIKNGKPIPGIKSEKDIFQYLGIPWQEPSQR
jgi:DNA polymerase/3'-5' exonuclease PolX/endonuclease IV